MSATVTANTYVQLKERFQREFSELDTIWAFSTKQLEEGMKRLGCTPDDLVRFAPGGYMRRSDVGELKDMLKRQTQELTERMSTYDFAFAAFLYEMGNHEYHINGQADWDVVSCFGTVEYDDEKGGLSYLRDLGFPQETLRAYEDARREYFRQCDENGWW